jgi:predicted outer membrane repeat protein
MAVYTVTTLIDENDSGVGGTGLSLREAIAMANASAGSDTIYFASELSGGTIRLTSTLTIADKLTIDGDGDLLDGGFPNIRITGDRLGNDKLAGGLTDVGASRAAATLGDNVQIFAASAALTLEGLILTGGSAAGAGGAVFAPNGLTIINSAVSGNNAGASGGAIWVGGTGSLSNVTISSNSAASNGGGIAGDGLVTFVSATIGGNSAGDVGGGIDVASVTLVNSTVSGNRAANSGSGINATTTTLRNAIVSGNGSTNIDEVAGALNLVGGNIVGTNVYSGNSDVGDTTLQDVFAAIDSATGGGTLAYDGQSRQTIALKDSATNPAIDSSDNSLSTFWLPFDHPDVPNVNGSPRDLGAAELFPTGNAPKNFVPGTQSVEANTDSAIVAPSIQDPDAGSDELTATLSVLHGVLSLTAPGGASISGNGTSTIVLNGTLDQINAALASDLTYRGAVDYFGTDTLTMTTNDNGNGALAPLTDIDHLAMKVKSLITGTPDDDSFAALPGNERIDAGSGIDSITFGFKLTDATVRYVGNTVIIDGPAGSHTVLTGFEKLVFTDGTANNADGNPLVDDLFYYARNHDVWSAHVDADQHYSTQGWHEGRDPSAFFSTTLYLAANLDVKAAGVNPLTHFDQFGWREGRVPSLDFDPREYLSSYTDVAAAHIDPLWHFLAIGAGEGRLPFAPPGELLMPNGFDFVHYLQNNPDVAAAGVDPFWHFQTIGWKEGRNPNALFDTAGYLATYTDVAGAQVNPLDHYNTRGWHEGRDPSVGFDTTAYLAANPDVAAAHLNPLLHYLQFGQHEGRSAVADGIWG